MSFDIDYEIDFDFYRETNVDLSNFNVDQLLHHYMFWGKKEGRIINDRQAKDLTNNPNFDIQFYKSYYKDLQNFSSKELIAHYVNYGKKEERLVSYPDAKKLCKLDFDKNPLILNTTCVSKLLSHIVVTNNSEPFDYIKKAINNEDNYNGYTNCFINKLYFDWINDSINNKRISIVSPINNKIIYTNKYFITTNLDESIKYTVCNYYFDNEEIILGIGLGTGNCPQEAKILYVYNIIDNILFYYWTTYSLERFKNYLLNRILNTVNNKVKNYNFETIDSKVTSIYGFMNNMGHMLFNDYTGLYLLDCYNIPEKIDEIIFGSCDIYHIKEYFQNFKNITFNHLEKKNDELGKGVLFKYNHHFISENCIHFLKTNLLRDVLHDNTKYVDYITEKNAARQIKNIHYPIINIVLRKGDFEMNEQSTVISSLINLITNKYPNAFFYLDGFVKNNSTNNISLGINNNQLVSDILNKYVTLVDEIKGKITTTNCMSLINKNILNLITHVSNCNYGVYILGSAVCNSGWICKIPGIQFGRPTINIYKNMDKIIRENMPDINYYYDNTKITLDNNENFNITAETIYDLLPEF